LRDPFYQAVVDGLAGPKYGVKAPRGSRFTGVDHYVQWNYLEELGWTAVYPPDSLMRIEDLAEGRLVVDLTMRHTIAVIVDIPRDYGDHLAFDDLIGRPG
jgi:hypothetical protein